MIVAGQGGKPDRKILDNVWGEVPKEEVTALMGPSGAGKTSLLNILAGRASSHGRLTIRADIRFNNMKIDTSKIENRKQIAFVAQEDSLMITATPRECILFSGRLRLPKSVSQETLEKLTTIMLRELGLNECADTLVGGGLVKGISGGQKKRTSVGVELVVKPPLIFLDEPTSGLDAFSAVQLVDVLKRVAKAGASVLFTIHQPSSDVFDSLDRLVLMKTGKVMYQGAISKIPEVFRNNGYPVPPRYNPADWIMSVAQLNEIPDLTAAGFFPKDRRKKNKKALAMTIMQAIGLESGQEAKPERLSVKDQIILLLKRELVNFKRDKAAIATRLALSVVLSFLIGIIYFQIAPRTETNPSTSQIQSHAGGLLLVLLNVVFGSVLPAVLAIPYERPVFVREYSTDHYGVIVYFISKATIEAVITFIQCALQGVIVYAMIGFNMGLIDLIAILYATAMSTTSLSVSLGCTVADPKMAIEMLPVVLVAQLMYTGFFIPVSWLSPWLRWLQYFCALMYTMKLFVMKEFSACGPNAEKLCLNMMANIEADPENEWWYW
eukprot:CAMPEP_0178948312 /NCGR_PEP_ID=MMETSP0789-20121207/5402_1 /TAXON_ID=3005 /ORGANISM="Rhizosolenia setigera, Strain CCMP 1694" /LENGTH=550 /DNA_ID=CAMNT_0020628663 /DNA_START=206 /DNA_END=1855 /DNA_ORIENTATION=+